MFINIYFLPFLRSSSGSWFIQALCHCFNESSPEDSIHTVLTKVKRYVSLYKVSNTPRHPELHQKRQIPLAQDTLIRDLYLKPASGGEGLASALPPAVLARVSNQAAENTSMHGNDRSSPARATPTSKRRKNKGGGGQDPKNSCSCM